MPIYVQLLSDVRCFCDQLKTYALFNTIKDKYNTRGPDAVRLTMSELFLPEKKCLKELNNLSKGA